MPVVVVGVNHKSAPVELLERLTVAGDELPKALTELVSYDHVVEGAILSTCNRIEIYAVVSRFHAGTQDLRNFLSVFRHVPPEDFVDHAYAYHDEGALRHLLRVAGGIDSMVVGESEILGQVRSAWRAAKDEGSTGRLLNEVFEAALRVGKRARAETAISRNPASISSAAVDLARRVLHTQSLAGRSALIVGAGAMARLSAESLRRHGAGDMTVVSRSLERTTQLARLMRARARSMHELSTALAEADIVITSTSSTRPVVDRSLAESALMVRTASQPLLVIDIAVPRDVDPAVAELPGVILRDLDDVRTVVDTSVGSRLKEVVRVEDIIDQELVRLARRRRSEEAAPTAAALVAWADSLRQAEVERAFGGPLASLGEGERAALDGLTRRIVAKLLHPRLEEARSLSGQGDLPDGAATREPFDPGDFGEERL